MFIYKEIRSEYFGVLFLLSILYFLMNKSVFFRNIKQDPAWIALVALSGMSLAAYISYILSGMPEQGEVRIIKYSWFILSVPVYFLFREIKPEMKVVWIGIIIGSFVAGGRALLEEFKLVEELAWDIPEMYGRANGVMHPIRFGDLSLATGFISLAGSLALETGKTLKMLGWFGFVSGLGASFLSGTRGAWIAIPLLLWVVLRPWFSTIDHKEKVRFIIVVIMGSIIVFSLPAFKVGERIRQAQSDIAKFIDGDSRTSIGARLDMIKTSISIFTDNPIFGVGVGKYQQAAVEKYRDWGGQISPEVIRWKNPHNELLLVAATRGLLGVFFYLFLFVTTFIFFKRAAESNNSLARFVASSGLVLVAGFFIFGMSIALFEHRDFLLFFLVYLVLFLSTASMCIRKIERR